MFGVNTFIHISFLSIYIALQVKYIYKRYIILNTPHQIQPIYLTIPVHLIPQLPTLPQGIILKYTVEQPPIHIH